MGGVTPSMRQDLVEALSPGRAAEPWCACAWPASDAVLDDHHRTVDDDAEVQGPRLIRLALTRN